MSWEQHRKYNQNKLSFGNLEKALGVNNDKDFKYLEKVVLGTGNEIFEKEDSSSDEEISTKKRKTVDLVEKKPAWVDEDDDQTLNEVLFKKRKKEKIDASGTKVYQNAMEKTLKEIMGVPKWAQCKNEKPSDSLLTVSGEFIKKPKYLNKDILQIQKLKDINYETKSEGPFISVIKFHPKSTVAMVAGSSGIVSLFQVDGTHNTKLHSVQFQKYPIFCGSFLNNGEEFIVGSRYYKYFYCHNMVTGKSTKVDNSKFCDITKTRNFCVSPKDDFFALCGNNGQIYLFSVSTKEFVDALQMNCNVTALCFSSDGSILYSHGEEGEVYAWDMKSRCCVKKFFDDGCLIGSSIAASSNNQFLACGSTSGVVNVYNSDIFASETISPIKTIFNLVTPVTNIQFNTSGEILAIASNAKENALKLVHCSSMTVFSNFPSLSNILNKPTAIDFSPNSGYFAIGNNKNAANLFRLKYYGNY